MVYLTLDSIMGATGQLETLMKTWNFVL